MKYYKIIINDNIIAVATSNDFKFAIRNNILLNCSENKGQYLYTDNKLYHAEWMNAMTYSIPYVFANVSPITQEEYNILYDSLYNKKETIKIEESNSLKGAYTEPPLNIPEYQDLDAEQLLAFIQEKKLKELSYECNRIIENGFDLELLDGLHHFSLTMQDQLNLITISTMIAQGQKQIPYHADGETYKFYTAAEARMIIDKATSFKAYHTAYFNALKNYIKSLNDPYVIANITYGIELPEEYKTEVLKSLQKAN